MPVTIGSGTIGSTAITGNPPAGQAGKVAVIPKFKIRVLDPVSGAVKIDPLPYTHMSEFEVIMPQSGMSGSSAIGHFVVHLFHPMTDEYAWYKAQYDLLDQAQRVEFYLIDSDSPGATGDPVFTGVISNLPKEDYSFRIEGEDSLKLLELSRTLQSDTFTDRTDNLVKYALKTYQLTKGDDWTGDLSAYSNNGSWSLVTDQGFSSVKVGFANDGLLYTTATYANSKYADCFVETPFHVTCGTSANATANPGVIAAVTDVNNMVLGAATMRFVAAGQYAVDASLWQKSGGTWTLKAQTQGIVAETQPTAQVTVTLVGVQTTATTYTWRVLINEIDSKCVWVQTVTAGNPTGGVGMRVTQGTSAFSQHHLVFFSKANAFQPGNIAVGNQQVNQPIPSQANIDLLTLAMSTEGWVWRKNPKAGLNNDQIDFAKSVGGDLSGVIRLEQDITVVSSQTEANAEPLNTAVLTSGNPGYNNIGMSRWYDITAINRRGMMIGPHVIPHTSDSFALRQMGQNVLLNRKQPTQAKRLTVLRSEDHAELPNHPTPSGLAYREGDWVTLHEPRKGLNYQRIQIISVKVVEGVPTMALTGDQYPVWTDRAPLFDRMVSVVRANQLHRSDSSIKDPNGTSFDRRLVLPNNPWKFRTYLSANQTLAPNAVVTVTFDATSAYYQSGGYFGGGFDTSNGFDTVNHIFTVPVSGVYFYSVNLTIDTRPTGPNSNLSDTLNAQISQFVVGVWSTYIGASVNNNSVTFANVVDGVANVQYVPVLMADSQYFLAGSQLRIDFFGTNSNAGGGNNGNNFVVYGGNSGSAASWSMHLISG